MSAILERVTALLAGDITASHERRDTTACSAKQDTPRWWFTSRPPRCSRRLPDSSAKRAGKAALQRLDQAKQLSAKPGAASP